MSRFTVWQPDGEAIVIPVPLPSLDPLPAFMANKGLDAVLILEFDDDDNLVRRLTLQVEPA